MIDKRAARILLLSLWVFNAQAALGTTRDAHTCADRRQAASLAPVPASKLRSILPGKLMSLFLLPPDGTWIEFLSADRAIIAGGFGSNARKDIRYRIDGNRVSLLPPSKQPVRPIEVLWDARKCFYIYDRSGGQIADRMVLMEPHSYFRAQ